MNVWIPNRKLLMPSHEIMVPVGVRGFFKIEAVDQLTGRRRKLAEFPNLITTNGGNLLGNNPSSAFTYCSVGTGNNVPSLADTTLQTFLASASGMVSGFPTRSAQAGSPYFGSTTFQFNFPAGTATGNLSEVGIGVANNGTNLFSRALILNGGGSPTTITVLASEALYVTYQLNQYVPLVDVTGSILISAVSYNYTLRAMNANQVAWAIFPGDNSNISTANAYDGSIGSITSQPSGTSSTATSVATNAYSAGSMQMTGSMTFGLTQGNFVAGIKSVSMLWGAVANSRGEFQIDFTSNPIMKDASHVLTLNVGISWAINVP